MGIISSTEEDPQINELKNKMKKENKNNMKIE